MTQKEQIKKNLLVAVAVVCAYLLNNLLWRIFATQGEGYTVMAWLFGQRPTQLPYLIGWLLNMKLYWIALAISAIPALFGKHHFSVATTAGFAICLVVGEIFGDNPAGDFWGFNHYGWEIWILGFLFTVVLGSLLQWRARKGMTTWELLIWTGVYALGILAIVLFVRSRMVGAA